MTKIQSLVANSKAETLVRGYLQEVFDYHLGVYERLKDMCESPIEEILLAGLYGRDMAVNVELFWFSESPDLSTPNEFEGIFAYPQAKFGAFRTDFLFRDSRPMTTNKIVVVECDGHDFHEKTKDQAKRDKARDRWMVAQGAIVLRFTGSEIFNDPEKCVSEIMDVLDK